MCEYFGYLWYFVVFVVFYPLFLRNVFLLKYMFVMICNADCMCACTINELNTCILRPFMKGADVDHTVYL